MREEAIAKWLSVVVLGLGALTIGLLPPILVARLWGTGGLRPFWRSCMSCVLCLGAGIFLSTALVHMTEEARAMITGLEKLFPGTAVILLGLGFLLIFFTDEMVNLAIHDSLRVHHRNSLPPTERQLVAGEEPSTTCGEQPPCYSSATACQPPNEYRPRLSESLQRGHSVEGCEATEESQRPPPPRSPSQPMAPHRPTAAPPTGGNNRRLVVFSSMLQSIVLLIGLFLNYAVEGFLIALEPEAKGVFMSLIVVALHKFAIAFCLGAETVLFGEGVYGPVERSSAVGKSAAFLVTFALSSFVGVLCGTQLPPDVAAKSGRMVCAIIQLLASGALVYVSLIEIIPRERSRCPKVGLGQFAAVTGGFVIPVVLNYFELRTMHRN